MQKGIPYTKQLSSLPRVNATLKYSSYKFSETEPILH